MTIKLFNGSNFNTIVQRVRVFREGIGWTGAKKISAYRDNGTGSPFWSLVYPDAPAQRTSVSIVGEANVGSTLSLNPTNPSDIWFRGTGNLYREPDTVTVQWQRSPNNSTWSNISGATGNTYTTTTADLNNYIRCRITAQNAKTVATNSPVVATTTNTIQLIERPYGFAFGQEFGVNANGFIMLDKTNGVFPSSESYLISSAATAIVSRILGYFMGDYRFYDLAYKSNDNYFRLYVRMYNNSGGTTRPSLPPIEYEIVFNNFTNAARPEPREFVDVFVANEGNIEDISNYIAYAYSSNMSAQTFQKYNSSQYVTGRKFTVPMNSLSSITSSISPPSNAVPISTVSVSSGVATITTSNSHNHLAVSNPVTIYGLTGTAAGINGTRAVSAIVNAKTFRVSVPGVSNLTTTSAESGSWASHAVSALATQGGWIYIGSYNTSSNATVVFTAGGVRTNWGSTNTFNSQNMFVPNGVQNITFSSPQTNSVTASWSNTGSDTSLNAKSYIVEARVGTSTGTLAFSGSTQSTNINITGLSLGTGYTILVTPNSRSDTLGQSYLAASQTYTHALAPGSPTNVTGVAGNTQVTLNWTAPLSNGGAAITSYKIQYSSNSGVTWLPTIPLDNGTSSPNYTVTQLTNGTAYIFRVAAVNSSGQGPWSISSPSITPIVVPTQITLSVSNNPISTLGATSVITAQLKDGNGNNISESGRSITFSMPAISTIGYLDTLNTYSVNKTFSSGQASATFNSGVSGNTTVTISAFPTGIPAKTTTININYRTENSISLTTTQTLDGYRINNSQYKSAWSYTGTITPTGSGSLAPGNSFGSTSFNIDVPIERTTNYPSATVDTGTRFLNCQNNSSWVINPTGISTKLDATRSGYSSNTQTVSSGPSRAGSFAYLWQFSTTSSNGPWTDWQTTQSFTYSSSINATRWIRCRVTVTAGKFSDTKFSNVIRIN